MATLGCAAQGLVANSKSASDVLQWVLASRAGDPGRTSVYHLLPSSLWTNQWAATEWVWAPGDGHLGYGTNARTLMLDLAGCQRRWMDQKSKTCFFTGPRTCYTCKSAAQQGQTPRNLLSHPPGPRSTQSGTRESGRRSIGGKCQAIVYEDKTQGLAIPAAARPAPQGTDSWSDMAHSVTHCAV